MTDNAPTTPYDALVVGGGPAGLAAALQLARLNRSVALFDAHHGRSSYQQVNHNYLGFPGGIPIRQLRERAREQVREYHVAMIDSNVKRAVREGERFCVDTDDGRRFEGRAVVIATGVVDDFPHFPDWEQYVGRSLVWCIMCDGYQTRGKRVLAVGNSADAAVTALQLLRFTSDVTLLTDDADCRIDGAPAEALREHGVRLVVDRLAEVHGDDGIMRGVTVEGGERIEAEYLFSLRGQHPNSALAQQLGVELSPRGYVVVDPEQHTNVPGVFAAGDVTRQLSHQVSTAVHEGNTAASAVNYYLYPDWQRHESYED